jgi:hypothetical protein
MDFAPYQDTAPDQQRALSPSPPPRRDASRSPPPGIHRNIASALDTSTSTSQLPPPSHFGSDLESGIGYGNSSSSNSGFGARQAHINLFETSLPMRLDYEAVAAYVLLPPAGAVFLLLFEHKSDFVR